MNLNVKIIKTRVDAVIPQYATEGSAACDLTACIGRSVTLMPHCMEKIPTGIAIAPEQNDVVGLVYSRSGMGAKHGITLANSVGVIDSDYRGEIVVALVNHRCENITPETLTSYVSC